MRILNGKTYFWLILFVPIFLCTCAKRDERLIVGVWKVESFTLNPTPNPGYWVFDGDGNLKIYHDDPSNDNGDTASTTYKIVMKSLVLPHLEIFQPNSFTGLWRIEKLNKSILVISRVGFLDKNNKSHPFLRREFVSAN